MIPMPLDGGCPRGGLLRPRSTTLALASGLYLFMPRSDAHSKVVCGGVEPSLDSRDKDVPPEPKAAPIQGDHPSGDTPTLTIRVTSCQPVPAAP